MQISLKAARVNSGLTQKDVAIALHKSRDTIRNWESGKSYPDVTIIKDIENLYSIKYDDIVFLPKVTLKRNGNMDKH